MYLDNEANTPETYARQIAYISNPSTIRVRVMEEYGRAPSIERIRKIQAERRRKPSEYTYGQVKNEPTDDFKVRGLVKTKAPATITGQPKKELQSGSVKFLPMQIIEDVCSRLGLSSKDVVSNKGRAYELIHARRLIAVILRYRGRSYPDIGDKLGGRDHSTIINLCAKISKTYKAVDGSKAIFDEYAREWDRIVSERVPEEKFGKSNYVRRIPCLAVSTGRRFASFTEAAEHMRSHGFPKAMGTNISRACYSHGIAYGTQWELA